MINISVKKIIFNYIFEIFGTIQNNAAETHRGGAELWGVVVDVGHMYDCHAFTCQSHAPHIGNLQL